MGKIKTFLMGLGVLFVLALIAFVSPARNMLITHAFYHTDDYPEVETISVKAQLPEQHGIWSFDEKGWRYTSNDGKEAISESLLIGDNEYFFDKDGYMETGWTEHDKTRYYLTYAGRIETGWFTDGGKEFYLDKDGKMATGWARIDNKNYFFGEDGALTSGWVLLDDVYYYINEDGTPHIGWLEDNSKYYYLDKDGAMQTGWLEEDGFWYYLEDSGAMLTGWQTIEGKLYFLNETGQMHTGWLSSNGNTYFFDNDGLMATGWLQLGDDNYYMDGASGAMRANSWIYDGDGAYFMDAQGLWVPNKKISATIALTFDDGPASYTDELLDVLKVNHAKATFFVLGSLVDEYPEALKKMVDYDFEIGNHSYSHPNLTTLSEDAIKQEIKSTKAKVKAITGVNIKLVRPPGGNHDEVVRKAIKAPFIMWSLDTLDWQSKNVKTVVEKVLNNVKDGDIVLMHDIHPTSLQAAKVLIPTLSKAGVKMMTVSELAKAKDVKLKNRKVYNGF